MATMKKHADVVGRVSDEVHSTSPSIPACNGGAHNAAARPTCAACCQPKRVSKRLRAWGIEHVSGWETEATSVALASEHSRHMCCIIIHVGSPPKHESDAHSHASLPSGQANSHTQAVSPPQMRRRRSWLGVRTGPIRRRCDLELPVMHGFDPSAMCMSTRGEFLRRRFVWHEWPTSITSADCLVIPCINNTSNNNTHSQHGPPSGWRAWTRSTTGCWW